ncbi:MAG: tetratricopeptide repeat protein [Acidobacteriaceae bacterium]
MRPLLRWGTWLEIALWVGAAAGAWGQTCTAPESMKAQLAGTPTAETFADVGILLANQKQYGCAARAFAESLRIKPDSANVAFMFGTSLFFAGDAQDAVAPLQAAEQLEGWRLKTHLVLAAVFDQLHRIAEAKEEWRAALVVDPESEEALDGLSEDLVLDQEFDAAIAVLEQPRAERQRTAVQSLNLGLAYAGTGKPEQAVAALQDGLNTTPDSLAIANELGDVLALAGRMQEAYAVFAMARERHPEDLETGLHFLRVLIGSDAGKAKQEGQDLLRAFPKSWEALYLNGVLAMQEEDFAQARGYLSQSIALNGEFALTHSALGVVLARMNDPAGAKAELERGIALGDDSQEVQENLARVKQVLAGSQ